MGGDGNGGRRWVTLVEGWRRGLASVRLVVGFVRSSTLRSRHEGKNEVRLVRAGRRRIKGMSPRRLRAYAACSPVGAAGSAAGAGAAFSRTGAVSCATNLPEWRPNEL